MIGQPEATPAKEGMTGHFKKPVDDPIQINELGLQGDTICDLNNHGGADQAVYLFGEPDRAWWADHLKRDVGPGFFGENILVADMHSADMVIGDILTMGEVTLQITSPRIPCLTYAAHIGTNQAIKDFFNAERPGAYGRVLKTGKVSVGDPITLAPYTGERITVVDNMRAYRNNFNDPDFLRRALTVPAHYKMHHLAKEKLGNG